MSATKKILLVDDNDFILCMMEKFISEWPEYETSTASNGQEAIDMINQEEFDLVITDILMPKKNGIELVTEIQKRDQKIPVIVISAGDGSLRLIDLNQLIGWCLYWSLQQFGKTLLRLPTDQH